MYDNPFHEQPLDNLTFLVTGGAGFIGSALVRLLVDHAERQAMGRRARERALSTFDLAKFTARYRCIYQRSAATVPKADLDDVRRALEAADSSATREYATATHAAPTTTEAESCR